jgi:hypothetical protein
MRFHHIGYAVANIAAYLGWRRPYLRRRRHRAPERHASLAAKARDLGVDVVDLVAQVIQGRGFFRTACARTDLGCRGRCAAGNKKTPALFRARGFLLAELACW